MKFYTIITKYWYVIILLLISVVFATFQLQTTGVEGKWHHCNFGKSSAYCCQVTSNYLDVPNFDIFNTQSACEAGRVGAMCFSSQNPDPGDLVNEGNYLCTDSVFNGYDWYCDVDDIQACECKNSKCVTECNNGDTKCSSDLTKSYYCTGGKWVLDETCISGYECKESYNTNDFMCLPKTVYYCYNPGTLNCITRSISGDNCYTSLSECNNHLPVICLTIDKKQCLQRSGDCLSGEDKFMGTDIQAAMDTCSAQIPIISCTKDSDCTDGNDCTNDKCEVSLLKSECSHTQVDNCDAKKKCESNILYEYVVTKDYQGGYLCKFLGIGCTEVDASYCRVKISVWLIVAGIVIIGLVYLIYGKRLRIRGKK